MLIIIEANYLSEINMNDSSWSNKTLNLCIKYFDKSAGAAEYIDYIPIYG